MIRKSRIIVSAMMLILLAAFSATGQTDITKYPDYEEVVSRFLKNYSIAEVQGPAELKFEKRPSGWQVAIVDVYPDQATIKSVLYWSRKTGKYEEVDFPGISDFEENIEMIEKYLNDWSKRFYRLSPYYGYVGWDWDVIEDFKDKENLSDSTLYALGRAYSSFASNLLNNFGGMADQTKQFNLPAGNNSMTAEQLEEYRLYRHKAIEKFKQLTDRNPQFKTIVGSIGIKASNEYMTSFLDMRMYQNETEANKELVGGLYNDFWIAVAKNYLNSCPSNAIMFSNGDNDTYPLLYVQSKLGVRKDVMVVNISLLQTDRYINSLRDQILDAPGLPISLTPDEISGSTREIILVENREENPMELEDVIGFVRKDENVTHTGDADYPYIPSNKLKLTVADIIVEWEISVRYFYRSHLIMLDLLATNKWKRPVCFSINMAEDYFLGLSDYFQVNGLTFQLTTNRSVSEGYQNGSVNSDILYNSLMNKFDWSGLKTITFGEEMMCNTYRNVFHRLASTLISEQKKDSAKIVLDKCMELMPNQTVRYDHFILPIIEDYYALSDFSTGNKIARELIILLHDDSETFEILSYLPVAERKLAISQNLVKIALKYEQQEIVDELEK
ncbi:MAG: hypothetical protein KKA07_14350 [Bacteroidetes bacterium]|nr:hypothetical protein [Bacteroidota bacterium]MBU1720244.1 hypothetical protein [Bacteroidota bacterium]